MPALERARDELATASNDSWPDWIGELYAARRRNAAPASFMAPGAKYALPDAIWRLFPAAGGEASR